jgi:peptidoglycan DL-endopeptidase LytF
MPGDTLFSIAHKYGTTVAAILAINPQITNPNLIFPGQVICVPVTPLPPPPPTCPTGSFAYTVMPGDTLFTIAQQHGTTVAAILAINPQITNPDLIYPGQVICVPVTPPPPPPPACPTGSFQYAVQMGDTLYTIAPKYGTTVAAILALNPQIVNPDLIYPGQLICVPARSPVPPACPTGSFRYAVQQGDTLFFVAQRYGTTTAAILAINPQITTPDLIYPGQLICVPVRPPLPPVCPTGSFSYPVQLGDTVFLIAQRYGTTMAAILAINPQITNPDLLHPGQLICVPAAVVPPPVVCPAGSFPYTVVSGDTLFFIAQRYGTTVAAIVAINPQITNPDLIYPGQVICVPGTGTPTPPPPPGPTCPAGSFAYTVVSGDTLFFIAQRYGTTVAAIVAINPQITNPDLIHPGQVICVPGTATPPTTPPPPPPPTCPVGSFRYTVKSGDTLFFIAQRYGTTVTAILAINPQITNPDLIFPGQIICVPGVPEK